MSTLPAFDEPGGSGSRIRLIGARLPVDRDGRFDDRSGQVIETLRIRQHATRMSNGAANGTNRENKLQVGTRRRGRGISFDAESSGE